MLVMILACVGMFLVTLLLQFLAFKTKKMQDFWIGTSVVFVVCVIGILSKDPTYFAIILGYLVGDGVGHLVGWH